MQRSFLDVLADFESLGSGQFEVGHGEHLGKAADMVERGAYLVRHALDEGCLGLGCCFGAVALDGQLLVLRHYYVAFALQLSVLDFQLSVPAAVIDQEDEYGTDAHNHGDAAGGKSRPLFELCVGGLQFVDCVLLVQMVQPVVLVDGRERVSQFIEPVIHLQGLFITSCLLQHAGTFLKGYGQITAVCILAGQFQQVGAVVQSFIYVPLLPGQLAALLGYGDEVQYAVAFNVLMVGCRVDGRLRLPIVACGQQIVCKNRIVGEVEIGMGCSLRIAGGDGIAAYFLLPVLQRTVYGRIVLHPQLFLAERVVAVEEFARRSAFGEVADGFFQTRLRFTAVADVGIAYSQRLIGQKHAEALVVAFGFFPHVVRLGGSFVKLVVPDVGFGQHCPDVVVPLALVVLGADLHAPCRKLFERVGLIIIIIGNGLLHECEAGVVPVDGTILSGSLVVCSVPAGEQQRPRKCCEEHGE